jgi:hypothetical protein
MRYKMGVPASPHIPKSSIGAVVVVVVVVLVLVVVVVLLSSPQPANNEAPKVRLKASFFRSIPISPLGLPRDGVKRLVTARVCERHNLVTRSF